MNNTPRRPRRVVMGLCLTLALLPILASCGQKTKMLGIVGFNYTDRYIVSFAVDGAGGGDVDLSDSMDGGGKTSCCIGYNPYTPLPVTMTVKWTFGYERGPKGNIVVPNETHVATAELNGPVPADPQQLEVHFMPDGTVQLRITREGSRPLVNVKRSEKLLRVRALQEARWRAWADAAAKRRETAASSPAETSNP